MSAHSMVKSVSMRSKIRPKQYADKLQQNAITIDSEVQLFNQRQLALPDWVRKTSYKNQCTILKKMTMPKFQNILMKPQFNPELPKKNNITRSYSISKSVKLESKKLQKKDKNISQYYNNNHNLLQKEKLLKIQNRCLSVFRLAKIESKYEQLSQQWNKMQVYKFQNNIPKIHKNPINRKLDSIIDKINQRVSFRMNTSNCKQNFIQNQEDQEEYKGKYIDIQT